MIFWIAPSGGNNSYICMKLIGKETGSTTTYHDAGTHSDGKQIINIMHYGTRNENTKVVVAQDYNNVKNIMSENDVVIQNYIDDYRELLLINWFEKNQAPLGNEPSLRYGWKSSWIAWQQDLWKDVSKLPVTSAVCEWMCKLWDNNFEDIKRQKEIEKVFNWSCMYKSSEATVAEFENIGYNYTVKEHDSWLASQKNIIDIWKNIRENVGNPMNVTDDIWKGIAMGIYARNNNMTRQQVENHFNLTK
jgi:hypothetical protein